MGKRFQVRVDDAEYRRFQRIAEREEMTVSAWARQALQTAAAAALNESRAEKLGIVRAAARHAAPTSDVDQMLAEVEVGCPRMASR